MRYIFIIALLWYNISRQRLQMKSRCFDFNLRVYIEWTTVCCLEMIPEGGEVPRGALMLRVRGGKWELTQCVSRGLTGQLGEVETVAQHESKLALCWLNDQLNTHTHTRAHSAGLRAKAERDVTSQCRNRYLDSSASSLLRLKDAAVFCMRHLGEARSFVDIKILD